MIKYMITNFYVKQALLMIMICLSLNTYSQSTFNINIGTQEDESFPVIELLNDSYILLYNIQPTETDENNKISVDYINKLGDKNNIHLFSSDTCDFIFGNIIRYENSFFIHGLQKHIDSTFYRHWLFKMDEDLSIVWQKTYDSPFDGYFFETEMAFYNNHLIVASSNFINNNTASQFLRFNMDGNLVHQKTYNSNYWEYIRDLLIIDNSDAEIFYAFGQGFDLVNPSRLTLNEEFDIIDEKNTYVLNEQDAEWISDTSFVLCGSVHENDTTFMISQILDTNLNVYSEALFKHPSSWNQHVAAFNSLDLINNDYIYLGGTTHLAPMFTQYPNYVMLNKLDLSFNIEWQKFIGGDAQYILYSIKTTPDGGCIMAGSRYDWNTQYNERDIFVMKVDENGLITSVEGEDFQVADAIVYPNPGSNKLQIQSAFPLKEIRMMDVNGRMVLQQPLNYLMDEINVNPLNAGTYIYQIIGRDDEIQHGKWMKM
ncbi:MAG: T9SS type A sorting domain-containing protein [Bacteroidales bacterium]|nr:T9SS type A sorting domain-containing protein [Bacteroidales bacterium]